MIRALTMLNQSGDTTIAWEEDADDKMEAIIAKKMKEGITFFIIEPRLEGKVAPLKRELTDPKQALAQRAVSIRDEDLLAFVETGDGAAVPTPAGKVKKSRISRVPKDVARAQSVGVQQHRGG